jgi:hypothetical protein
MPERPGPRPRAIQVERHGINTIPDADRTSKPIDLFRIQFGGANTFATVIIGTAPVALGLSLPQALAATLLGVLVGAVILAPMGLFAPGTGTNNAVSSGAHLGVRGRIVGSFLSLLTAIAFYSISVWVSGDARELPATGRRAAARHRRRYRHQPAGQPRARRRELPGLPVPGTRAPLCVRPRRAEGNPRPRRHGPGNP